MPHEFWREVVDRVAAEVPGTLLLAEAFWLMEGYFVRTLGMHRVYNSAFMVMLRDEDNAKYRSVIKNTLEFDPDIMKRYVNFMSNPDERTAIDQFGKGDKCFGVAAMMATLPGLPMFGHGQIEGFTEKYGMEYQRPRYDETPDPWLVERHEREIAPLLKRRWLFAESGNFLLYDFFHGNGTVDENVFAYSNRSGGERALVVYNNRYGDDARDHRLLRRLRRQGRGSTAPAATARRTGPQRRLRHVIAWRDSLTGLEYLRRAERSIGPRTDPGPARLPVPRLSRLARTALDGAVAVGPALRLAQRRAACPISTMRWSIWSCSPRTTRCAGNWSPASCACLPASPNISAPAPRERTRKAIGNATNFADAKRFTNATDFWPDLGEVRSLSARGPIRLSRAPAGRRSSRRPRKAHRSRPAGSNLP